MDSGIYVSKKLIFQLIVASIVVNVLFLLLGMVIGKDDGKWQAPVEEVAATDQPQDDDAPNPIEMEMTIFERDREAERAKPIDVAYLDDKKPDTTTTTASQDPAKEQAPEPVVERTKPDPKPPVTQATDGPIGSTGGSYFIQVVASKDRAKIEPLREQLAKLGYRVFLDQESDWTRLLVGYFPDHTSATKEKAKSTGHCRLPK